MHSARRGPWPSDVNSVVEQLVAQASVEALDEGILGRLARCDVVPLNPNFLAPAQHRHAGQLGAVVGNTHRRSAAPGNNSIEFAHDPQARQRGVGDRRQALAREVVDDSQNAEAAAFCKGIRQEVQAPALIGPLRNRQRRPCAERPLASAAPAHL